MTAISTLKNWAFRTWGFFWNSIVRVLWLCSYTAITALIIAYFFIVNDQGKDLLRISTEKGFSTWNIMFFLGTITLSLALWYCARLLLGRKFDCYPLNMTQTRWGREWLPRLLGGSASLSIAVGFLLLRTSEHFSSWLLAALYLITASTLVWFFTLRRKLFLGGSLNMIENQITELERPSRILIILAVVLSFVLLVSFVIWPVWLPQALGAPAIIVLGLAGIVLFGSIVLTYAFLAKGQPAGTALALVLAVVFGFFNDNHWVRMDSGADPLTNRPSPIEQYLGWRAKHADIKKINGREPIIIVAASGGGIRAAYWTAATLASLDAIDGFTNNLFAISGVSGGSLGAATYVALKQQQNLTEKNGETVYDFRDVLSEDFLSPVVAGLLFTDLVQRFIPFPIQAMDRQRFLESAWESAFGSRPNPFSRAFSTLFSEHYKYQIPSLLLNATVVDSGQRAIVSNIDVNDFTDTIDLLEQGYSTQHLKLSSAVGLSARFTYVSPAGSLETPEQAKMRIVDGGYFENSGAASIIELLNILIRSNAKPKDLEFFPILILIRNDPGAPSVCHRSKGSSLSTKDHNAQTPGAGEFLNDISAPVRALLNARTARGRLAEVNAAITVEQTYHGHVFEIPLAAVVKNKLAGAKDKEKKQILDRMVEPPLGWSLSKHVREAMDQALERNAYELNNEFQMLEAVLDNKLTRYQKCNPQ